MRKFTILCMAILLVISANNIVAAQDSNGNFSFALGFDINAVGINIKYNADGAITNVTYINIFLGVTFKTFFTPVEFNKFNFYWQWGTVCFIMPYIGVGGEYITSNGFYFGFGTYYIAPTIYIGKYF